MVLTRQLKIIQKHCTDIQEVTLRVGDLKPVDIGWACHYSIDKLKPRPFPVCGRDPMEAYYQCLNFVEGFVRQMEVQGYRIWFECDGDHGGFQFDHTRKECP